MIKSIKELREKIKPEIQIAAREKAAGIVVEMGLVEERKIQELKKGPV